MDFRLSEDQDSIRALAMRIFEGQVTAKTLKEAEAEGDWLHRRAWEELAKAQLVGVAVPEEFGGAGLGFVEVCVLLEQQGRTAAPAPLLETAVLGALPIAEFGAPDQKRRFLPPAAAGDLVLTAALVEADSDDPARPSTRAARNGSGWRLTGEKTCVPYAHLAGRILVPARTEGGVGVFLLSPKSKGVRIERQIATSDEPLGLLTLQDAFVEDGDVLGDAADGARIVDWIVERALVALSALELGVAQKQLERIADHAQKRHQFERPIGAFQAVAQRGADSYIDVDAIRLTTWQAAWRIAEGLPAAKEALVAKFWAAEGGQRVAYASQHIHGGLGYDKDSGLYRYYLLAKRLELALGGASRQLERLGAALAEEHPGATA